VESIEASGKNIDEAVQQALVRLGKRRDEVEIVVLQEPTRGTFGLGSKDARVRVTVRPSSVSAVITPEMADAILGPDDAYPGQEIYTEDEEDEFADEDEFEEGDEEYDEDEEGDEFEEEEPVSPFAPVGAGEESGGVGWGGVGGAGGLVPARGGGLPTELFSDIDNISAAEGEMQEVETPSPDDVEITVDVLQHILHYMNIRAAVQVRSTNPLTLNIQGINENLGLLIGRRGETLSALQLLVSLIVGHRTKHRMRIIIDAENYRERREENLRSLALRVAQQVRNYRRSIALEAMPPHERRIVHIALSDSKDISTESIGEGEARRVVISLKRPGRL
jgi:spoIIIJ-associated protein